MTFEFSLLTQTLLDEISNPRLKQADIAKTCAAIFLNGKRNEVDWKAVNSAIVERWSKSARERVLTMAWKMAEEKYSKGVK